jgi:hypothetical protein
MRVLALKVAPCLSLVPDANIAEIRDDQRLKRSARWGSNTSAAASSHS